VKATNRRPALTSTSGGVESRFTPRVDLRLCSPLRVHIFRAADHSRCSLGRPANRLTGPCRMLERGDRRNDRRRHHGRRRALLQN
jgi:hypothetical protein